MKKTLIFIATVALCATINAQMKVNSDELYNYVGETYYNVYTNCNSRNTIGFHSKSLTGAAVWTMAQSITSRGTGINYCNLNTNTWGESPNPETDRIETVRTGWGTHGFTNAGEVVAAHDGTTGLIVNTREMQGQGNWQQATLTGPSYLISTSPSGTGIPTTVVLWPAMATSGNTVHLVCATEDWPSNTPFPPNYEPNPNAPPYGYQGFPTLPLYYRSTDGGKTWEAPRDFRAYGMTNFECFRTIGDGYAIAVRGDHVVVLYNNRIGFINYMESKDGGDTWVKKTVYDNGMALAQVGESAEPRLVPTASAIYIDENHKVHVVFGAQCHAKNAGDAYPIYWPNALVGMIYWNDEKEPINWQDIRGWKNGDGVIINWNWENYPGYIALPSVVGLNKFYLWEEGPYYNTGQFGNTGFAAFPKILAKDGRIYVAYQSPLDYPLSYDHWNGHKFFRGIFITVSEDYGETWNVQENTSWISYHADLIVIDWDDYVWPTYDGSGNPIYYGHTINKYFLSENGYPSMSYNYKGDMFMVQWLNCSSPFPDDGTALDSHTKNVLTFTQDLKNIPAYKNIQEVYKGLWNGQEPGLEFPPVSCEKPTELKGIIEDGNVVLNWEEPEYVTSPVLGYNVFRNGNKLTPTPITVKNYIDENVPAGTFLYQISTVYSHCESKKLGITLYLSVLCEKPAGVSGTAEGNKAILTWNEPENIDGILTGYNVYRNGDKIGSTPPTKQEYTDNNLANGTYIYQISARYQHCLESELTDGESVVIFVPQFCEKPEELSGTTEEKTAILTWKKPEKIDGILLGYNVYRDGKIINKELVSELEYRDEALADSTYIYQISAKYEHCESELSDGISIIINNMNDYQTGSVTIYPNPTTGEFAIQSSKFKVQSVEVYDVIGKKISSHHLITSSSNQLDISHLSAGIYLVRIHTENGAVMRKMIKQ